MNPSELIVVEVELSGLSSNATASATLVKEQLITSTAIVTGPRGEDGSAGPGLPAGGVENQVVIKQSNVDYDYNLQTLPTVAFTGEYDDLFNKPIINATNTPFTPDGDIIATDTQAAVTEVRDSTDTKLALKATDTLVVHKSGIESVAGAKTFSDQATFTQGVTLPTPSTGTDGTNKTYVDAQITANATPIATLIAPGKVRQTEFNIRDYGAVGDGVTDDTAALNAAIAAAVANGGGTVRVPGYATRYLILGAVAIPYTGSYFAAVQPPIKIVGDGANWNGRWPTLFVGTGSVLDLRYTGADGLHPAKIDTRGAGYLEFNGITFASGPDDFPIIQTTNTTVFIHNCAIQGNPTKSGQNCVQDFMHFGGTTAGTVTQSGNTITGVGTAFTADMVGCTIAYNGLASSTKSPITGYVSPTELTTSTSQTIASTTWGISTPCNIAMSPFQGYGSKMENNYYGRINRAALFGNYTNNIIIQNETFSTSCGSTDRVYSAPYVMAPSFSSVGGNTIAHATIEGGSYAYGVALVGEGYCYTNNIDFIGIYDDHGDTFGAVYCGPTAYYNQITTGWFNSSLQPNYVAGPNKIYQNITSASQNMPNYSYVGYWSNNYIAKNITTVNPDLPLGTTMTLDTGTGGSNFNVKANTHQIMDKNGVVMSSFKNSASAKGVYQLAQGTTANRPSAVSVGAGSIWYDTTLGRKITSDGASWIVSPDDSKVVHNTGDTITIPIGGNAAALTLRQNDTTNNPKGMLLVQAAANIGLDISQQGNGQGIRVMHNDTAVGGSLSAIDVVRTANSASLVRGLSVSVTNAGAGGTAVASFTGGPLTMGAQKITGVADPTSAQDAATKAYVDAGNVVAAPTDVTGTTQALAVNVRYMMNNAGLITATLPAAAAVGDQITIFGKGAGMWIVAQRIGQTIRGANGSSAVSTTTGTGGSVAATGRYNSLTLVCITANTEFLVTTQNGTLTVV
jgi:hypothetical protein